MEMAVRSMERAEMAMEIEGFHSIVKEKFPTDANNKAKIQSRRCNQ
jgi:hypothetical protein